MDRTSKQFTVPDGRLTVFLGGLPGEGADDLGAVLVRPEFSALLTLSWAGPARQGAAAGAFGRFDEDAARTLSRLALTLAGWETRGRRGVKEVATHE
jgi:hypothetical protein